MASKRKFEVDYDEDHQKLHVSNKKHTLDSDEEDSDDYEKDELNDSDIEGEEEGIEAIQDEVKITPFNMREELQEGHFDKDGHYHWNKDADVKDNWLDNIDWVKVKTDKNYLNLEKNDDSSNESDNRPVAFNEGQFYGEVLVFMQPNETVQKTLQRLGKNSVKISSAERLRRKREGIVDDAGEKITKFTELINEILTRTGNMDIYQETYRQIKAKLNNFPSTSKRSINNNGKVEDEFDMYADDFEEKEKKRLETEKQERLEDDAEVEELNENKGEMKWEFKWKQEDSEVHGPYSTQQMQKWTLDNYFKHGVYVRKVGESTNFYSSNRIDFDLYL